LDVVTISIGNTHATAKGWNAAGLSNESTRFTSDFRSMTALADYALTAPEIVLASVVKQCSNKLLADLAAVKRGARIFRQDVPTPLDIVPQPAEKVGDDRLAAVLGALAHDPHSAWIVIDAGTAVTCNAVVPAENGKRARFEGGLIYPGAAACLRALNQSAAQLTNVNAGAGAQNDFQFIGRNTEEAMRWGVMALQASALGAIVDAQQHALQRPVRVALTGGGALALLAVLQQTGLARDMTHDPDLVHRGLFASWLAARPQQSPRGRAED
jgi:type III pantothenate kinase